MTLLPSKKTTRLQCYGHWQGLQKFCDGNNKIVKFDQVRTQTGLYIRPVSQIVPLERERPESQLTKWKTADDSMDEE